MSAGSPQRISVGRGDDVVDAECQWSRHGDAWQVELSGPFETAVGTGPDAFAALEAARLPVEQAGWRVGITGARLDAWPSGMARDMGSGLQVYVLKPGQRPTKDDLVDTFSPADLSLVGTLAEQRDNIARLVKG